jgi:hypothetical protein
MWLVLWIFQEAAPREEWLLFALLSTLSSAALDRRCRRCRRLKRVEKKISVYLVVVNSTSCSSKNQIQLMASLLEIESGVSCEEPPNFSAGAVALKFQAHKHQQRFHFVLPRAITKIRQKPIDCSAITKSFQTHIHTYIMPSTNLSFVVV